MLHGDSSLEMSNFLFCARRDNQKTFEVCEEGAMGLLWGATALTAVSPEVVVVADLKREMKGFSSNEKHSCLCLLAVCPSLGAFTFCAGVMNSLVWSCLGFFVLSS